MTTTIPTVPKITRNAWKRLALLSDPEDAEAIRTLLVEVLEALDAMTDD